jgi:hypothetical protein
MTQTQVTREQALAIVELIKEQTEAAYARLVAMPTPDLRLKAYAGPSALRKSAARLRAGKFRPSWMTGTPEETAREYEAAADYCELLCDVRRLAKTHQIVKDSLAKELFNQVKENFLGLKKHINEPWMDPITAENILTLRRDLRRDLGRK